MPGGMKKYLSSVLCSGCSSLNWMVRVPNLKYWGRCETVILRTLQFLNDLSVGDSLLRRLVKIDTVKFLLQNHTSAFPFLGHQ